MYDTLTWTASLKWRISPIDVLTLEDTYPGLWEDLNTELWQRNIISELMDDQDKTAPKNREAELDGVMNFDD